jgi:tRNA threonylcarbamoyladenosine biosynthesis protein TsaE
LLREGDVVGLTGNLGAGKTAFVQGLASGLQVPETVRVTSPTFSLVNEYAGGRLPMVHMDLYRIEEDKELEHLGLEEMMDGPVVSAVEWCERFDVLPDDYLQVTIHIVGDEQRQIEIQGTGPRSQTLASAWSRALGL